MPSLGARWTVAAIAAATLAAALAGCGESEQAPTSSSAADAPGSGGAFAWALADSPGDLDPLLADSRASQLVTRQVHEPLVESLSAPFGELRRLPGIAASWSSSAGETIWSFTLRQGVRFQDGSPLNAAAVVANADRWRTSPQGRALMPDLFAADAPRPDLVRFFLRSPDPGFPELVADPRTGIVSPRAIRRARGGGIRQSRSGTGPFELRERDADSALVARNLSWWGTARGLGPDLDQVDFRVVESAQDRLALLEGGDIQAAEELGPAQARTAMDDPLLEVLGDGPESLGLQRSVRGISSATEVPSMSGVWVTRVSPG